jgi:hypothetical protein
MGGASRTHGRYEQLYISVGKPERKNYLNDFGTDGRSILEWKLKN